MGEKKFLSIDEQIDLLIKRGFSITTPTERDYAKRVLKRNGYYNIINGYNDLFIDSSLSSGSEIHYKPGTTIKEINALYEFDRVLREIFLKYILKIEVHLKSLISYYFPEKHGHRDYLIYKNFDSSVRDASELIPKLISDIHKSVSNNSKDPSIAHYMNNHGYIPLWVINNILTLGTVSKFYSLMLQPERQAIAKEFHISENELKAAIYYVSIIRNFCAHDNRLYCFRSRRSIMDSTFHDKLCIPRDEHGKYTRGKNDLFACVIVLKLLLSNNDYKRFEKHLYREIGYLNKNLTVLSIKEVLDLMGFPENWRSLKSL